MAQKYHIACIDCMFRYIEAHVFFYSSVLTQVADSFQVWEEEVELPTGIFNWFKTNLDNSDVSNGGLDNVEICLDSTAPFWQQTQVIYHMT